MKSLRRTLKYLIGIVLVLGVSGAGAALWWWQHSDEMLRKGMLEKFAEFAPELDVQIGRCRFDFMRTVYIDDLVVKVRGQASPIMRFPKTRVLVDREALARQQRVIIHKVRLLKPQYNLIRDSHGHWNFQDFPPLKENEFSLPEWEIEQGIIDVRLEHAPGKPATEVMLDDVNLQLIPSGKRKFVIKGGSHINSLGHLAVSGHWDVDNKTWSANGSLKELRADKTLVELLSDFSPQLRIKLAELQAKVDQKISQSPNSQSRSPLALYTNPMGGTAGNVSIPDFGISALVNVDFRLSQWQAGTDIEYKLLVGILRGELSNPLLPYALHDLTGKVYCDNREILLRELSANNGATRIELDGRFSRQEAAMPARLSLVVKKLPLDERLRGSLSVGFRKIYDMYQPKGQVDVHATLNYDGIGRWLPEGLVITAHHCAILHEKFPYQINDISGTAKQQGDDLVIEMRGMAGRRPVIANGIVKQPGPAAAAVFDIRVDDLPINDELISACPSNVRKILNELNLKGTTDTHVRLTRPAGLNQKTQIDLVADIRDGSLEYTNFPYSVEKLTGSVSAIDGKWSFTNLKGVHGTARLRGHGTFMKKNNVDQISLDVNATGARLDESLKVALPASLQMQWNAFSPTGNIDVSSEIRWTAGTPVKITLPNVDLFDGTMLMTQFPFPVDEIRAKFSYVDGLLDIKSFFGKHDDARFRAKGFTQFVPNGEWRLRLVEVSADRLSPDRSFRRALPTGLREVISCLDPQHPVSISGMMEFRGTENPNDLVTAAWDLETIFSDGAVTIGMDYKNLHGRINARGTWDGRFATVTGNIDFDRASILGYGFTNIRGPFHVKEDILVVGSADALSPVRAVQQKIPLEDHVTAKAIGGIFTIDAAAKLQKEPVYQVKMAMSHGKLEEYAKLYIPKEKNLRGTMNGWIVLQGKDSSVNGMTGKGQLQISPAALYELPVVAQMFNVLRMAPPDKTAFNYALLDFNIANSKFVFRSIDLVGSTVSLRGRGTAAFEGDLALDFYSMLPRTQLPIPLLSRFVDEATKGWVGIEVRGKVDAPVAKTKAVPKLDGALKQFLAAFGKGVPPMFPPVFAPLTIPPNAILPQSRRPLPQRQ